MPKDEFTAVFLWQNGKYDLEMEFVKYVKFLMVFFVSVMLSACLDSPEADIAPQRIYTSYNLIYDEENNRTLAGAIFSADTRDGWRQELPASATVAFNGESLILNEAADEYLIIIEDQKLTGEFRYEDSRGEVYVNQAQLKIIGYPSGLDTIDILEDFEFTWVGDALEEGEVVTLRFEEEQFGSLGTFTQDELGAESLVVPRLDLTKMGVGNFNLRLLLDRIVPSDENPEAGGEVRTSTWLLPLAVTIQ